MISARRVALAALKKWRTEKRFADSIISELLAKSELDQQDRGFAMELFYGVLRNLSLLDFWIRELRMAPVRADLRDLLRLGLYQLLVLQTAPHAAVFETVDLAPKKQRPVVNAILRTAIRKQHQLINCATSQPLSVQWSHPDFLLARWRKSFGDDGVFELCQWNNRPAPLYARINCLKITPPEFLRAVPGSFPVLDHHNFVRLPASAPEAIAAGYCYIQDPSTATACDLMLPRPGEKILDACAAPGGKTGYLAEKMQNRGTIVACDRSPERIQLLRENLSRLGVSIAKVAQHDWEKSAKRSVIDQQAPFDRILVDAPCSNTGVMRRRIDVRWRLRTDDFIRMHRRQVAIVNALADLLKPSGILVYSTCSIEPEENEGVAKEIERTTTLRLEKQQQLLPFQDHFDGAFAARFVKHR